jgi:hypothetical protein
VHLGLDALELCLRRVYSRPRSHDRLIGRAALVAGRRVAQLLLRVEQLLLGVADLLLRVANLLLRLTSLLRCLTCLLLRFARLLLRLLGRLASRLVDGFLDGLPDVLILLRGRRSARNGDEREVVGRHGEAPGGLATKRFLRILRQSGHGSCSPATV